MLERPCQTTIELASRLQVRGRLVLLSVQNPGLSELVEAQLSVLQQALSQNELSTRVAVSRPLAALVPALGLSRVLSFEPASSSALHGPPYIWVISHLLKLSISDGNLIYYRHHAGSPKGVDYQ